MALPEEDRWADQDVTAVGCVLQEAPETDSRVAYLANLADIRRFNAIQRRQGRLYADQRHIITARLGYLTLLAHHSRCESAYTFGSVHFNCSEI